MSAGATEGLDVPARGAERIAGRVANGCVGRACTVQVVVIHEGTGNGSNAVDGKPGVPWDGPIIGDRRSAGRTPRSTRSIAGHTHRVVQPDGRRHPRRPRASTPAQATRCCSSWSRAATCSGPAAATRVAKSHRRDAAGRRPGDRRRRQRPDRRAAQRGDRHADHRPHCVTSTGCDESSMGDLVADAMRAKYPGVEAAITNSGGLRASTCQRHRRRRRAAGRDHVG